MDDYIKLYDIFCVSESKIENGVEIDDFTVFNLENKTQNYPLPGIHGLHVYITNHIANKCVQITENLHCNLVIWIKIADSFIVGALYLPHEGSIYHHEKEKDETHVDLYDELALDIWSLRDKYDMPLLLTGDFNSRTGLLNEIMVLEAQDVALDSSYFNYPNIINIFNSLNMPIKRINKDPKSNNNGRKLVHMCKIQELCIVNGRMGSDRNIGDLTCAGASTVDYMICTPDLLQNIQNFTVDIFDPMLSDKHSPISVSINLEQDLSQKRSLHITNGNNIEKCITKCKWNDERRIEFSMSFNENKIDDIFLTLSSASNTEISQVHMDSISSDLKDILIEPAKATDMYKHQIVTNKETKRKCNKPWFNDICKASKNRYKKFKKTVRKQPSEAKKESLKSMAKTHKKVLRKEKRTL